MLDIHDGDPWSALDLQDLKAELDEGHTIEHAAGLLCRAGSVAEVAQKAKELGYTLTLVHRSKAFPESSWPEHAYTVMHEGEPVGSISKESMSGGAQRWWWEVTTREAQREPMKNKGPAVSRADAMAAFKRAWSRLSRSA